MKINELSEKTSVSVRTIRYYTQVGLLPEVDKKGTYKDYPEEFIERILLIKQMQKEFIPLSVIKEKIDSDEISLKNKDTDMNDNERTPQTISMNPAIIYSLNDNTEIISKNGNRISQEKLNEILQILER